MTTNGIRTQIAAVLGGLLLTIFAGFGQGTVVYHNAGDVFVSGAGLNPDTYAVDMDGNGTEDFVFEAYRSFRIHSTIGARSIGIPKGGNDLGSWSIPLLDGFDIGANLPDPLRWEGSVQGAFNWIGPTLHTRSNAGSSGYWNPQVPNTLTAYVGVEFNIGDNVNYGWLQVTVGGIGNGGVIKDWAYNTVPGEMIFAGQVPEPSTWVLLICGGSFLWWRCRKRMCHA